MISLVHPVSGLTASRGFKLDNKLASSSVSLDHLHLDGGMVLGTNDAVAREHFHSMDRCS